jgi:hypothetical protein
VLLPTWLFARRAYAGMIIWACVLARAAGAKVVAIAAWARIPVSTAAGWLGRVGDRADGLRRVLMGVLVGLDGQAGRILPSGSALGDAVAVLAAVTGAVRRLGAELATVTDQELVSHLTQGRLLAPSVDLDSCNTRPFLLPVANSS